MLCVRAAVLRYVPCRRACCQIAKLPNLPRAIPYVRRRAVQAAVEAGARQVARAAHQHAQGVLGLCYLDGNGVKQDHAEGFKWMKRATDNGYGVAMVITGAFYRDGKGVAQDFAMADQYLQRGIEHTPPGSAPNTEAMKALSELQEHNAIPTPPPGTRVTVVLLASAAAALKYNGRGGIVVVLPEGQPAVKAGRAAVLLEGEAKPISFKLMNLRIG